MPISIAKRSGPAHCPKDSITSESWNWVRIRAWGVRALHKKGITGKGVGLAILDQNLLTEHTEYKDRLRHYEEIHWPEGSTRASMHGAAVASIAVGKTVGVAPEADLYYIAEWHGNFDPKNYVDDFTWLAKSIDRILEINGSLPEEGKIRVISISVGWPPNAKGYKEVMSAVKRARKDGIFIVSSSLKETFGLNLGGPWPYAIERSRFSTML